MKQLVTRGIVLRRTNYGEADRIVTLLTPGQGKLRLMAKGSRKLKSKLAGGIELFSVSDITYMPGKGDMGTLISGRLDQNYGEIIKKIDRVQLGYELIKQLDKVTEDQLEPEYFTLLKQALAALNDPSIELDLIDSWFKAQLLSLAGHTPNLRTDVAGQALHLGTAYNFDYDAMTFTQHPDGHFQSDHIKILRLLFGPHTSASLNQVTGLTTLLPEIQPLVQTVASTYLVA